MVGSVRGYNGCMKVALLADPIWLMAEATTVQRLAVGLLDEGVQLVPVVPAGFDPDEADLSIAADVLRYEPSNWKLVRDWRIGRLTDQLAELDVDLIHALSGAMERPAVRLGQELELPVIASVWSMAEAATIEAGEGLSVRYTAPTRTIADTARSGLDAEHSVRVIRPGVFISGDEPVQQPLSDPERPPSFLVIGDGRLDDAYSALLEGMARIKSRIDRAMYFFYAIGSEQHKLWRAAESLGLQEHVSWVPVGGEARELLVQADVVVQPQATGTVRTIVLEAMRTGRPVIAVEDAALDYQVDHRTKRELEAPTPGDWAEALAQVETDREGLRALGESAAKFVRDRHSAAKFAGAMLDLYREAAPQPMPFKK